MTAFSQALPKTKEREKGEEKIKKNRPKKFQRREKGKWNEKGVKERKRNGGREGAAIIRSFVTGATPSLCVCNTI